MLQKEKEENNMKRKEMEDETKREVISNLENENHQTASPQAKLKRKYKQLRKVQKVIKIFRST